MVEIGWTFVARDRWGNGINAEVKRLMVAHALAHFTTVGFRVGRDNLRSRRAMEKVGAVLTDRLDTTIRAGVPVEHVVYEVRRAG